MNVPSILKSFLFPLLSSSAIFPWIYFSNAPNRFPINIEQVKSNTTSENSPTVSFEIKNNSNCKVFWNEAQDKKRLYICRDENQSLRPIFYYWEDISSSGTKKESKIKFDIVSELHFKFINSNPKLVIKLSNGEEKSFASYPYWMVNWKDNYLRVEEDCSLNSEIPVSKNINNLLCKINNQTDPQLVIL